MCTIKHLMKPGDFCNIPVGRILCYVKGAGLVNAQAEQLHKRLTVVEVHRSLQCLPLTYSVTCTTFHAGHFVHYCTEVKGRSLLIKMCLNYETDIAVFWVCIMLSWRIVTYYGKNVLLSSSALKMGAVKCWYLPTKLHGVITQKITI